MEGPLELRFEDVTQQGRLTPTALPHALSIAWRTAIVHHPLHGELLASGILPVLSRLVCEPAGGDGLVTVRDRVGARVRCHLAHVPAASPADLRIVFVMEGHCFREAPGGIAQATLLGRVWAEHVLSRPMAPHGQRRVYALPDGSIPAAVHAWVDGDSIDALPPDAEALEPEAQDDACVTVFGMDHTDGNHHVNSLVYVRLLMDAALRRLDALGALPSALRVRHVDLRFVRPSFATDRVRWRLQAFRAPQAGTASGHVGVRAALYAHGDPRPRVRARVEFD